MKNLNVQELSVEEQTNIDGGVLPLALIYAGWLAMGACSAVAVGFAGYHNNR